MSNRLNILPPSSFLLFLVSPYLSGSSLFFSFFFLPPFSFLSSFLSLSGFTFSFWLLSSPYLFSSLISSSSSFFLSPSLSLSPPPLPPSFSFFLSVFAQVGDIKDNRNRTTCPNFLNTAKRPSSELKTDLLTALAGQKKALEQSGESNSESLEKELGVLERWCKALNPKELDKEAAKLVKEQNISFTLP